MPSQSIAGAPLPAQNFDPQGDRAFQEHSLQGVSRTFALTIPQLPDRLETVVGNAYLLCRLADTIEDCPALSIEEKRRFYNEFIAVVESDQDAERFSRDLNEHIQSTMTRDESELVRNTGRVVRLMHQFSEPEREALLRCLHIMSQGMESFQEGKFTGGLNDLAHLDAYCYHVAGVVGEMLTDLFCIHSGGMADQKDQFQNLAVSFGQGLQMTNIIKDIWDDKARGVCWLPRDVFQRHGFDLAKLNAAERDPAFEAGLRELIAVAHGHLRNAMRYCLLVPKHEQGIRRFCLWAVYMAVHTLARINANPHFRSGDEVKISRPRVHRIILYTRISGRSDTLLQLGFNRAAKDLPPATP